MLDDGAPKHGHWVTLAVGLLGGAALVATGFGEWLWYGEPGVRTTVTYSHKEAPVAALMVGLAVPVLLLVWHRGLVAGRWPVIAAFVISAFFLVVCVDYWRSAARLAAEGATATTSWRLTLGTAGAALCTLASLAPLLLGAREVSIAHPSSWLARRARGG
jgi:hypothetical protein